MQQRLHTDIVQSFWLRFWREPHRGQHREWRGSIWHEQQAAHDKPTVVANPEEAFEFVRRILHEQDADGETGGTQARAQGSSDDRDAAGAPGLLRRLAAWWGESKGTRP